MRKGFTLTEVLVVVIILPFVFVTLDGLFVTLLAEIPRSYRIAQESITLQNMLEQLQQDMDKARGLPVSLAGHTTDDTRILVELPGSAVCYQQLDGQVVRRTLTDTAQDNTGTERAWSLPSTKVQWRVWVKDGRGYAVEVKTHIEYKTRGRWEKKMANAHLFYWGLLR
ncbi:MAG: hypothetical protein A2Z25_10215 [Planctomycetes bacterium RBG_16_55_9]|nr:MAG: hypothetical protein A2Z25_10215 [Planctomycetes bacterium RBG_16_55_9]